MTDDPDTVDDARDVMPGDPEPDVDTIDHAGEMFDSDDN